jgi:hypothetical protein
MLGQNSKNGNPFYTLRNLSAILNVSVRTLRRSIKARIDPLPAYRLGGHGKLIVSIQEFRNWLTKFRTQPATEISIKKQIEGPESSVGGKKRASPTATPR